jgi:hypothetical protein
VPEAEVGGYSTTLSALASSGPGHWIQRERAFIVNELLLGGPQFNLPPARLSCRRCHELGHALGNLRRAQGALRLEQMVDLNHELLN